MLKPGVYPASVTPMDDRGQVDMPSLARLLAWFEACGCTGAVLAGTNGEGPSLSAVEKRDLMRDAMPMRGRLDLVLGVATASLEEAVWLCRQAHSAGAVAGLVMAPGYFREASESGIEAWFMELMDRSELPILVYNFPQRTGVTLTPELLARLAEHERFAGAKDSSGSVENLEGYAQALPGKRLYVGNETLLLRALRAGWAGSISGAANVIPLPLSEVVGEWHEGPRESSEAKFELILPAIEMLRGRQQPATNKALLKQIGVIPASAVRLPLEAVAEDVAAELRAQVEAHTGPLDRHGVAAMSA